MKLLFKSANSNAWKQQKAFAHTFQPRWLSYCSCFTLFPAIWDDKPYVLVTIFSLSVFTFHVCSHTWAWGHLECSRLSLVLLQGLLWPFIQMHYNFLPRNTLFSNSGCAYICCTCKWACLNECLSSANSLEPSASKEDQKKPTSCRHLRSAILRRQLFLHPGTPSTHLLFVSLQMEWHEASYLLLKLMLVFPIIFFLF